MNASLRRIALGATIGLFAAAVAEAGAPGSANRKDALETVCKSGPDRGEVCDPTELEPCGTRANGDPHECVVDFMSQPSIRGTLTVITDETPGDNAGASGTPALTLLLEIRLKGDRYLVTKTFQSPTSGQWPTVGEWDPPLGEDDIQNLISSFVFQQPVDALAPVGAALDEITEAVWPGRFDLTGKVPMISELKPLHKKKQPIDQFAADLGRVQRYRVRIQYVGLDGA